MERTPSSQIAISVVLLAAVALMVTVITTTL